MRALLLLGAEAAEAAEAAAPPQREVATPAAVEVVAASVAARVVPPPPRKEAAGQYAPAAVCYAAHLANSLGRRSHAYDSAYETAYGFVPDTQNLLEFGSICAVLVEQEARGDPRAVFALSTGVRQSRTNVVGGFPDISKDGSLAFVLPDSPTQPRHSRNFKHFRTGLEELGRETIVRRLNQAVPPSRSR